MNHSAESEIPENVFIHPSCDRDFVCETIFHELKAKSLSDEDLIDFKEKLLSNITAIFFVPALGNMLVAVLNELDRRKSKKIPEEINLKIVK